MKENGIEYKRLSFNPRSRMGSDSLIPLMLSYGHQFQSTLPHGERQQVMYSIVFIYYVSIHAPAWGATEVYSPPLTKEPVSIHAPAWGATPRKR